MSYDDELQKWIDERDKEYKRKRHKEALEYAKKHPNSPMVKKWKEYVDAGIAYPYRKKGV